MSASDAASGWKNGSARSFVLIVTTAGIVATRDPQDGHRPGGWPSRRRSVLRDVRDDNAADAVTPDVPTRLPPLPCQLRRRARAAPLLAAGHLRPGPPAP